MVRERVRERREKEREREKSDAMTGHGPALTNRRVELLGHR